MSGFKAATNFFSIPHGCTSSGGLRQGVTQAVALRGGVTHRDMPTYKGDDGLTETERQSYAVCQRLSCIHEACYKRYMYVSPQRQQKECGPLMEDWKRCFREETQRRGLER